MSSAKAAGTAALAVALTIGAAALVPRYRSMQVRSLVSSGRTGDAYAVALQSGDEKLLAKTIDAHIASLSLEDAVKWLVAEREVNASPLIRVRTREVAERWLFDFASGRRADATLVRDVSLERAKIDSAEVDWAAAKLLEASFPGGQIALVAPDPMLGWFRSAYESGIDPDPKVGEYVVASLAWTFPDEKPIAHEMLARWFPERIAPFLDRALTDGNPQERIHALVMLKRNGDARAEEPTNRALLALYDGESKESWDLLAGEKDPTRARIIDALAKVIGDHRRLSAAAPPAVLWQAERFWTLHDALVPPTIEAGAIAWRDAELAKVPPEKQSARAAELLKKTKDVRHAGALAIWFEARGDWISACTAWHRELTLSGADARTHAESACLRVLDSEPQSDTARAVISRSPDGGRAWAYRELEKSSAEHWTYAYEIVDPFSGAIIDDDPWYSAVYVALTGRAGLTEAVETIAADTDPARRERAARLVKQRLDATPPNADVLQRLVGQLEAK